MALKWLGIALALLLVASCAEKPQESGPSQQQAEVQSRGAGDPLRQRAAATQNESARIYH